MRPDIDPTVVRTTRAWWTPICSCSWTAAKFRNADAARRTAVRHAMSAGADGGYDRVSEFFTEVFGKTIKVFGDAKRDSNVVVHGALLDDDLYALYGDEGEETIGALSVGQTEEVEDLLKQQVRTHAPLRDRLA